MHPGSSFYREGLLVEDVLLGGRLLVLLELVAEIAMDAICQ